MSLHCIQKLHVEGWSVSVQITIGLNAIKRMYAFLLDISENKLCKLILLYMLVTYVVFDY